MANVLLGVTGSVAAIKAPELYVLLTQAGHTVRIVATRAATYFFDPAAIAPGPTGRNPAVVSLDVDEWPGERYSRGDDVLHIELRRWAEIFVIAPLDANTLAKLANGLCDNCLTCVWRAWDMQRPVVLAPAMNTMMWEHPATARHLHTTIQDFAQNGKIRVVGPQEKLLACGDTGNGAMADLNDIVAACTELLVPICPEP